MMHNLGTKLERKAHERPNNSLQQQNVHKEKHTLGPTSNPRAVAQFEMLRRDFGFSIEAGGAPGVGDRGYVTHPGLLRLAQRRKCRGIHVEAVDSLCDSAANRY